MVLMPEQEQQQQQQNQKPLVTIKLSDGFGNQMFMIAAMLGYAERYGHEPVFYEMPQISKDHSASVLRVQNLFPKIRILSEAERAHLKWCLIELDGENSFQYIEIPNIPDNVMLQGYFQSPKYFPSITASLIVNLLPAAGLQHPELLGHSWADIGFLHVRRADYLHPLNAHHRIDVSRYVQMAVPRLGCRKIFVASDDMPWCKQVLPSLSATNVEWIWCPDDASDAETFYWMTLCGRGGICANSTFSWWAAWYGKQQFQGTATYFMPYPWGFPPLPEPIDLYPEWATVVPWSR